MEKLRRFRLFWICLTEAEVEARLTATADGHLYHLAIYSTFIYALPARYMYSFSHPICLPRSCLTCVATRFLHSYINISDEDEFATNR